MKIIEDYEPVKDLKILDKAIKDMPLLHRGKLIFVKNNENDEVKVYNLPINVEMV